MSLILLMHEEWNKILESKYLIVKVTTNYFIEIHI